MEIIALIFWIILSFVIASAGKSRKIGWGTTLAISLLLSPIVALVFVLLSDKTGGGSKRWKVAFEAGERAEFKGDSKQAVSSFMDAIYYLENDYKHLKAKDAIIRDERLNSMKAKVETLRAKELAE